MCVSMETSSDTRLWSAVGSQVEGEVDEPMSSLLPAWPPSPTSTFCTLSLQQEHV